MNRSNEITCSYQKPEFASGYGWKIDGSKVRNCETIRDIHVVGSIPVLKGVVFNLKAFFPVAIFSNNDTVYICNLVKTNFKPLAIIWTVSRTPACYDIAISCL